MKKPKGRISKLRRRGVKLRAGLKKAFSSKGAGGKFAKGVYKTAGKAARAGYDVADIIDDASFFINMVPGGVAVTQGAKAYKHGYEQAGKPIRSIKRSVQAAKISKQIGKEAIKQGKGGDVLGAISTGKQAYDVAKFAGKSAKQSLEDSKKIAGNMRQIVGQRRQPQQRRMVRPAQEEASIANRPKREGMMYAMAPVGGSLEELP